MTEKTTKCMAQSLISMIIDKSLPIYQIVLPNNPISEYYAEKSVESFDKFGYTNVIRVYGATPDNMPSFLNFSEQRVYTKNKAREWLPEEKAIWYSHYRCWHKVSSHNHKKPYLGPSLIIEHDCILTKELSPDFTKRNLFSFGRTDDNRNLAALGYYIKPSKAKELLFINHITMPVDGFLHNHQSWYPRGKFKRDYINSHICAHHYINPEIGTTKPTIGIK